jgi:hypothetical protein
MNGCRLLRNIFTFSCKKVLLIVFEKISNKMHFIIFKTSGNSISLKYNNKNNNLNFQITKTFYTHFTDSRINSRIGLYC